MMIRVNFIISLINYIEKNKPCHFTLFLAHRKLCLCVKSQTFNVGTKSTSQAQDNPELTDSDAKVDNYNNRILHPANMKETQNISPDLYVKSYVENMNPLLAHTCPTKYMRLIHSPTDTLYLFEKETAKKFVNLIIDDLSKNMTYVAEANPGTGVLTEELLKAGVAKVHAYEPNECFHPALYNLRRTYPSRLQIMQSNLFKMSKLHYMDIQDNKNRVQSIFMNIKSMPWEEKSYMQVIGTVTDLVFFKHLILCVIFHSCFMSRGRACFYLAIPPSIWNVLNFPQFNGRAYCRYILFQTLFDYKYLGDLKRTSYIPWQRAVTRISKNMDHETLIVIKLEPKANLFVDYLKQEQLLPYWYFLKYHVTSKTRRVIPDLEKWIPGCGIRLITKNYNIFTQFVDLKPNEILDLYKEFSSWPEYETCLFLSSAKSYIQCMNLISARCIEDYNLD